MNELISVVITSYGRTDTLTRAIRSLLIQTYSNIEIIVVDDNANESYANEIDKICGFFSDNRIVVIHNPKNLGGALARNEGIKVAKGKYIAFLDDDDEYLPSKIEKQYQLFKDANNSKLALVYCYCKEVKNGTENRIYQNDITGNCIYEAMKSCIAATSQWMCSKDALVDVGMFSDTPCKQDSLLICKLVVNGYKVDRVPEILSIYNVGASNRISTGSHKKRIIGENILRDYCRKYYEGLQKREIENIEYSFSCRLAEHYFCISDNEHFKAEIKNVLKRAFCIDSIRVYKHLLVGKNNEIS